MRVRLPLLIGRAVVCDRYLFDAIADVAADSGSAGGAFTNLLMLFCPWPAQINRRYLDVIAGSTPPTSARPRAKWSHAGFVLVVPGGIMVSRRQDDALPVDTATRQAAIYQDLAVRHNLVLVDNGSSFAGVNDPIVRAVIRAYFARYHTLVNALFMANPDRSSG